MIRKMMWNKHADHETNMAINIMVTMIMIMIIILDYDLDCSDQDRPRVGGEGDAEQIDQRHNRATQVL